MKVTVTELLPTLEGHPNENTITVENPHGEDFYDLFELFKAAALGLGFSDRLVSQMRLQENERCEALIQKLADEREQEAAPRKAKRSK